MKAELSEVGASSSTQFAQLSRASAKAWVLGTIKRKRKGKKEMSHCVRPRKERKNCTDQEHAFMASAEENEPEQDWRGKRGGKFVSSHLEYYPPTVKKNPDVKRTSERLK